MVSTCKVSVQSQRLRTCLREEELLVRRDVKVESMTLPMSKISLARAQCMELLAQEKESGASEQAIN